MTGTRSLHEYASGVFHSPVPRATWLESKVPQEGKDGRVSVRRVTTTHVEGYEVCALSPHHSPCLQKSIKNAIFNLGESLTVSAPRVTETWYQGHLPTIPQSF